MTVYNSTALGWSTGWTGVQTGAAFASFLAGLSAGAHELVLDGGMYSLATPTSGTYLSGLQLPDDFVLSAVLGSGFNITDYARNVNNIRFGHRSVVRNLRIATPGAPNRSTNFSDIGSGFNFHPVLGCHGKNDILIEFCDLDGIGVNMLVDVQGGLRGYVKNSRIRGGYWAFAMYNNSLWKFKNCLFEDSIGDGIKTYFPTANAGNFTSQGMEVDGCLFQDNSRDGIDTTGGFLNCVVKNSIFRRLGVSGLDLKPVFKVAGDLNSLNLNKNIEIINCDFSDMPNMVVLTTVDESLSLITAANATQHAAQDIRVIDCILERNVGTVNRAALAKSGHTLTITNLKRYGTVAGIETDGTNPANTGVTTAALGSLQFGYTITYNGAAGSPRGQQTSVPFIWGPQLVTTVAQNKTLIFSDKRVRFAGTTRKMKGAGLPTATAAVTYFIYVDNEVTGTTYLECKCGAVDAAVDELQFWIIDPDSAQTVRVVPVANGVVTVPNDLIGFEFPATYRYAVVVDGVVGETIGGGAFTYNKVELNPPLGFINAPVLAPLEAGATQIYVNANDQGRYTQTASPTNRSDVEATVYTLVRDNGAGSYTEVEAAPLNIFGIMPNAAVAGSADGTANICVKAYVETLDHLENATIYSNTIVVERKTGTAPAAPTITGPTPTNLGSQILTNTSTSKTWRPTIDLSAYSGGTIQKVEWCGLTAASPDYADPQPQQFEPCRDLGSGIWQESLYGTTSPTTLGVLDDLNLPFSRRYRVWVGNLPSAWSVRAGTSGSSWYKSPFEVPPPPVDEVAGNVKQFRYRRKAQFAVGEGGGMGQQSMNSLAWEGDRMISTGDFPSPQSSHDGGNNWQPRRMKGYNCKAGLSSHIHPDNTDLIHVVGHVMSYTSDALHKLGLYRSVDGGESYTQCFPISLFNGTPSNTIFYGNKLQQHHKWIVHSRINTNHMWCVVQQRPGNTGTGSVNGLLLDKMQAGLWRSSTLGAAWNPVIPFGSMNANGRGSQVFGHIFWIVDDPLDINRLYVCAEGGLFRSSANPTADGHFALVDGGWVDRGYNVNSLTDGLFLNQACRSLWMNLDGTKGVYTIDNIGVKTWRTGGIGSATKKYPAGTTLPLEKLLQVCVNKVNTEHCILGCGTRQRGGQGAGQGDLPPKFTTNFFDSQPTIGKFGRYTDSDHPSGLKAATDHETPFGVNGAHESINAESTAMASSNTDGNTFIVSDNRFYRTTTGGIRFDEWENGHGGPSVRDISCHPTDRNVVFLGVDDIQSYLTQDGGVTLNAQDLSRADTKATQHEAYMKTTNTSGTGTTNFTGLRCLASTDGSFLIRFGRASGTGQLFRIYPSTTGSTLLYQFAMDANTGNSQGSLCHDAGLVKVYAGSKMSTDHGKPGTWVNVVDPAEASGNFQGVCGASPLTTGIVWGFDPDEHSYYRGINGGIAAVAGQPNNWTFIVTLQDTSIPVSGVENAGRRFKMWPHPTNDKRCFIYTYSDVYEIGTAADMPGSPRSLKVNTYTQALRVAQGGSARPLIINAIAVDYVDPAVIYVGLGEAGYPTLIRTLNGLNASPSWAVINGHNGYGLGAIATGGITAAANQTSNIGTDEGENYATAGYCSFNDGSTEISKYTRSGDVLTFTTRGTRGTTAAIHVAGTLVIDIPEINFLPNQAVQALDVHRTDRTLVVGTLGDGLYAVKPEVGPGALFANLTLAAPAT